MTDQIIMRYVNNEASDSDKQQVRDYILEDFEQLTEIMLQMRQRAMNEIGFREDALLKRNVGLSFTKSHPVSYFGEGIVGLTADFNDNINRQISLQKIIKDFWEETMSE